MKKIYNVLEEKIVYQYEDRDIHQMKISDNVKSIIFTGKEGSNNAIAEQMTSIDKINSNITAFGDYCVNDCTLLTSINFEDSNIQQLGEYCFKNCSSLSVIDFGKNVKSIGEGICSQCGNLQYFSCEGYEKDLKTREKCTSNLENIPEKIFENTTLITSFVIPENVKVVAIDHNAFNNMPINGTTNRFVFMNMSEMTDQIHDLIIETHFFGFNDSCLFEFSEFNGKTYTYDYLNETIIENESYNYAKLSDRLTELPDIKSNIQLNTFYLFDKEYVKYCLESGIPFVVIYFDSKTSTRTLRFIENFGSEIYSYLVDNKKCVYFILDRANPDNSNNITYYTTEFLDAIVDKDKSQHIDVNSTKAAIEDLKKIYTFPEAGFYYDDMIEIKYKKMSLVVDPDTNFNSMKAEFNSGFEYCNFKSYNT